MRFLHLSDLHLGKRLNEFSLIDDQKYILEEILGIVNDYKVEVVVIAGDVYDKSVPCLEAINLFDEFLFKLSDLVSDILIISGNHDSGCRLSFGSRLMSGSGVHFCGDYKGVVDSVKIGDVNFYLLPFIKPINVREYFEVISYNDAVKAVVSNINLDNRSKNIFVTHQFITGSVSEDEVSVGGSDNVDGHIFNDFDYVAIGHIHSAYDVIPNVRYCGTPLKYSISEANDVKSVTIVDVCDGVSYFTVDLKPLRDLRCISGFYSDIVYKKNYEETNLEDYISITLFDEEDIIDVVSKLRVIYPNLMKVSYDNIRTRSVNEIDGINYEEKFPFDLFNEFYELQNNMVMSEEQSEYISKLISDVWGDVDVTNKIDC